MPVSRAFLYISFRVPSKGDPPPGSPYRAPIESALFPDPSFICLSRVPSKRSLLQVPQRGPYGESCPFPEPSFTCLSDSPIKLLLIEKSHSSLEFPEKGASPPCSAKRDPYGKRRSFPEPYLTSFRVPVKELSLQVPHTDRDTLRFQSPPSSVSQSLW